jgi:uncharacterized paraquat-inducible protein A
MNWNRVRSIIGIAPNWKVMKSRLVKATIFFLFFVPIGYGLQYKLGVDFRIARMVALASALVVAYSLPIIHNLLSNQIPPSCQTPQFEGMRYCQYCQKDIWPKGTRCTRCGRDLGKST